MRDHVHTSGDVDVKGDSASLSVDSPSGAGGRRRFYGWTMLGVATVAFIATGPGQTVVVSQFNTAIRDDLGISASALGTAYMAGTVAAAGPLVLAGKASDRFGPRRLMGVVAVLLAISCALTGMVQGVIGLTVAFFLLRFLGQGVLGLVSGHQLALWFERRLGTVSGLKFVGVHAGFAVMPALTLWLIELVGWRLAFACLGVMVAAMVLPLVVWVARDRPEEVGQRIDGDPPVGRASVDVVVDGGVDERGDAARVVGVDVGDGALTVAVDAAMDAGGDAGSDAGSSLADAEIAPSGRLHLDPGFTLVQALRAPAFWVINATLALSGMIGTALIFHAQPMLVGLGVVDGAESAAAGALRVWSLTMMLAIFPAGWLADRVPPRLLLPAALVLLFVSSVTPIAGGMLGMSWADGVWASYVSLGAFGLSQALTVGCGVPTLARYFGRAHHGAIRGASMFFGVVATGLGPVVLALSLDHAESFVPGLVVFAAMCVPPMVAGLWLKHPVRRVVAWGSAG